MTSRISDLPSTSPKDPPPATPPKVPRLVSLEHRLQHAKDADGNPFPLRDELLFFLDDPPPGTADRWQAGADLCADHGISTSRMSVWRFYRAHILAWRREQAPPTAATPPSPEEIAGLQLQARYLAAQRALEILHHPHLPAGQLISFLQSENHRQRIQFARDQFNDRVTVRSRMEERERFQKIEAQARDKVLIPAQMENYRKLLATLLAVPPDTTS